MLPIENRLKKRKDISLVLKKGKSFRSGLLVLKVAKNNLASSRFAFIVSTKVSKKAVTRNKIRRQIGEAARFWLKEMKTPSDIICIALPGIEKKVAGAVRAEAEKILSYV